jgi:hypothetical protein
MSGVGHAIDSAPVWCVLILVGDALGILYVSFRRPQFPRAQYVIGIGTILVLASADLSSPLLLEISSIALLIVLLANFISPRLNR